MTASQKASAFPKSLVPNVTWLNMDALIPDSERSHCLGDIGVDLLCSRDIGIASCLDAKTGETRWLQRLGGNYSASPIFADGRIYFLSEEGTSIVIAPGKEFRRLAMNVLDGATLASMAVSGGSIFIRTHSHLYRIAAK